MVMTDIERAKRYVTEHCGSSLVKGVSINTDKGIARVIVRTEGGIEREMIISIPREIKG